MVDGLGVQAHLDVIIWSRAADRSNMLYQLRITTAEGKSCALATKFASAEEAITTARLALRHGATAAGMGDENGNTVADLKAIRAHGKRLD